MTAASTIFTAIFITSFFTEFTSIRKEAPFQQRCFLFFSSFTHYHLNNCNRNEYPSQTNYHCKFFPIKSGRIRHKICTFRIPYFICCPPCNWYICQNRNSKQSIHFCSPPVLHCPRILPTNATHSLVYVSPSAFALSNPPFRLKA